MKFLTYILAGFVLTAGALAAKKPALPDAKISDFQVGDVVSGTAVDLSNTGGKAVVIEAWGVNCPPCIASLPHMEKLAKRNKADTIFIGAESQGSSDDEIKGVIKKFKLSYTITKGGVRAPAGLGSTGIPHAYVFDTTGKLIFVGHPADRDFDRAVSKAGRPPAAK